MITGIILLILLILYIRYKPSFEIIESGIIMWYIQEYHNKTPYRIYKFLIKF